MVKDAILSINEVSCHFGSFKAVDKVTVEIQRGSITGLIGPNGAGKTTLFNAIAGGLKPTSGRVTLNGHDVTGKMPEILFSFGLGRTFQIPRPFARMSVLENVMLAPQAQIGERLIGPFLYRRLMQNQEDVIRKRAMEVIDFMTLAPLADHPAGKISGGQMKLLELARILMGDPQIILLDEPAAGVNPSLAGTLIQKIEELNAEGKTFLIIEHDMDFIMRHCNPVIALTQGHVAFQGTPEQAQSNQLLLDAYLGAKQDV
ncbi:MAG: ABC transporter ATP-binding protein [Paracoccaceae bacterium]|nr:ABC transporter ATP-binding protein [Paracoccaceae bacterium]